MKKQPFGLLRKCVRVHANEVVYMCVRARREQLLVDYWMEPARRGRSRAYVVYTGFGSLPFSPDKTLFLCSLLPLKNRLYCIRVDSARWAARTFH